MVAPVRAFERNAQQPEEAKEPVRGRIFNAIGLPRTNDAEIREEPVPVVREESPAPTPIKEPKPIDSIDEENDDDWGAVPAFLRRSKLK